MVFAQQCCLLFGALMLMISLTLVSTSGLYGIAYAPYSTTGDMCLGETQIQTDMAMISRVSSRVRLYGVGCASTDIVLKYAQQYQMQVLLGVWINTGEQANEVEISGLQRSITKFGSVGPSLIFTVSAGNEVLTTNGGELVHLISYMDRIRAIIQPYGIPLTFIDIPSVWLGQHGSMDVNSVPALPPPPAIITPCPLHVSRTVCALLQRVDWVGSNIHPYYDGLPVTCDNLNIIGCYDGPTWVMGRVSELKKYLGTSNIWVTEVGWPTAGEACCSTPPSGFNISSGQFLAKPSPANSALHMAKFTATSKAAGVPYFYFEAFNSAWKRVYAPCLCSTFPNSLLQGCNTTCEYEYNWGLWDQSRQSKTSIDMSLYQRDDLTIPGLGGGTADQGGSSATIARSSMGLAVMAAVGAALVLGLVM